MNMCWKCIIYVIRAFVLLVCSNAHTQTHKLARVQVAYAPKSSCSLLSPMVSWYSASVWSSVTAHIVSTERLCLISSWTHAASTHRLCVFLWTCASLYVHTLQKKQINLRYTVCLYHRKQSVAQATISFVILLSVKSVETIIISLVSPLSQQWLQFTPAFQSQRKVVRHIFVFSRMNIPRLGLSEMCSGQHVWKNKCRRRAQLQVSVLPNQHMYHVALRIHVQKKKEKKQKGKKK